MSDMVERVAGSISEARTGNSLSWRHYVAEAKAAIAAMQADAAHVADSEDWRKAWRNVALLSSEHEDVRLNEAVAELHSVFEAYAHPPVDNRVSTSSPVDDSETGNTSGKLRDAVDVWREAYTAIDCAIAALGDSHDQ